MHPFASLKTKRSRRRLATNPRLSVCLSVSRSGPIKCYNVTAPLRLSGSTRQFIRTGMQPHSVYIQVREVQEAGSIRVHLLNPWNLVEVTSLASLSAGFIFRTWAYMCHGQGEYFCGELSAGGVPVSDLNEVYLAQYFQAASAPFVLGKVLFLTQVISVLRCAYMWGSFPLSGGLLGDAAWQHRRMFSEKGVSVYCTGYLQFVNEGETRLAQ